MTMVYLSIQLIDSFKLFRLRIPSLHVYGEDDKVIGDMSQDLVPYFESPSIVQHRGGHFIPASAKQRELYVEFINKFR